MRSKRSGAVGAGIMSTAARTASGAAVVAASVFLIACGTHTQSAGGTAPDCVAWRSTPSAAPARHVAMSLGAGDRIGSQLEDARIARAARVDERQQAAAAENPE